MSISFFFCKLILNLMIFYVFHIVLRDKSRTYEETFYFFLPHNSNSHLTNSLI